MGRRGASVRSPRGARSRSVDREVYRWHPGRRPGCRRRASGGLAARPGALAPRRVAATPALAHRCVEGSVGREWALVKRAPLRAVVTRQLRRASRLHADPVRAVHGGRRAVRRQPVGQHRPVFDHATFHHHPRSPLTTAPSGAATSVLHVIRQDDGKPEPLGRESGRGWSQARSRPPTGPGLGRRREVDDGPGPAARRTPLLP